MKVKSFLKKIQGNNFYIEFIEQKSGASYNYYTKNDLIYNDRFNNYTIKKITFSKSLNSIVLISIYF
jgi:hypothetical protein